MITPGRSWAQYSFYKYIACTLQTTSKQVEIHNRLLRPCVSFLYAKHHSEMNATSAIIATRDLVRPPLLWAVPGGCCAHALRACILCLHKGMLHRISHVGILCMHMSCWHFVHAVSMLCLHDGMLCMNIGMLCMNIGMLCMNIGMLCMNIDIVHEHWHVVHEHWHVVHEHWHVVHEH